MDDKESLFFPCELTERDRAALDRDGHLLIPGLLTPPSCERLTGALSHLQALHEADPEHQPNHVRYAAECNDYMASLIGHPQMLALAQSVLGPDIRYDHCVGLNRRGGNQGSGWHSHGYAEKRPELGFIRIFFYVNGFARDDGNLKAVPGSHLYRDPGIKAADDAELREGWMAGKTHPLTGAPLQIEPLEAPPGSVVIMWTHAAHAVTPKRPDSETRWCVVYAYRNPGEPSGARWINEAFEHAGVPGTEGLMSMY